MATFNQPPDIEKLRELILYLAQECSQDGTFGAIKLQKLLFYSDFTAYLRLGKPITGCAYKKFKRGPVLTRAHLLMSEMVERRELHIMTIPVYNHVQKRPIALRDPILSAFSAQEIEIVRMVIKRFHGMTAKQISTRSHAFIGREVVEYGEEIPYRLALVARVGRLTPAIIARGRELDARVSDHQ